MKIIIIGGGIVGIMTALECAYLDAEVTLLERGRLGCGATGAAGGILAPLYPWQCTPPMTDLLLFSQQCWGQLLPELTLDDVSHMPLQQGVLCLDQDEFPAAEIWIEQHHWPHEWWDRSELRCRVPGLTADGGLLLSEVKYIDPTLLLSALVRRLEKMNVRIIENTPVQAIISDKQQDAGVQTHAELFSGDCVIVCAGAWSTQLCDDLHVRPVRGQMIEYQCPKPILAQAVVAEGRYLIPRPDGRLLVGSTVEDCGFDNRITAQARADLSIFAEQKLAALKTLKISRQWAGLRPGSPRSAPLLGWHPNMTGVFLNTGHFRTGIALASGSARLAAQMIHDQAPSLATAPFALTAD